MSLLLAIVGADVPIVPEVVDRHGGNEGKTRPWRVIHRKRDDDDVEAVDPEIVQEPVADVIRLASAKEIASAALLDAKRRLDADLARQAAEQLEFERQNAIAQAMMATAAIAEYRRKQDEEALIALLLSM